MMVRRETIDEVDVLDEGFFMYCEEVDWAMRMRRAGWGVYCVPAAEVVHHAGRSTQQFRDEMFVALWRSRLRLFGKHYGGLYNWAARRIVRLGLWREQGKARRDRDAGRLSADQWQRRVMAYKRVREMTYG